MHVVVSVALMVNEMVVSGSQIDPLISDDGIWNILTLGNYIVQLTQQIMMLNKFGIC